MYLLRISYGDSYDMDPTKWRLVESVEDLKSSLTIRGIHGPNFELSDAKIA